MQYFEEKTDRLMFQKVIWNLLRGHNINQTDDEFQFILQHQEFFTNYVSLLGLDLIDHPMGGVYYIQKSGKQDEPLLSAQICTIFFVIVQKISEALDDGDQISLFDLVNKFEGYDLENLLSLSALDPTQLNSFKDVNIRTDEELVKVLNTMTRVRFLNRMENSNYRFMRSVVRLTEIAQSLHEYEHIPIMEEEE